MLHGMKKEVEKKDEEEEEEEEIENLGECKSIEKNLFFTERTIFPSEKFFHTKNPIHQHSYHCYYHLLLFLYFFFIFFNTF
ncbi:hypothetical protein M0802_016218 [Mischocyttarus mexicanus]|nr:hypothetical protein M0802_016218 [Mischocyttarus mexicanus]